MTYKIEGNEVLVFQDEERDGGVSFPSSRPKVGDQVEVGSKEEKKSAKITKIESADKILNDLVAKDKPAEAVSVNPNLKYEIKDGTVTITGCDRKASGALTIPATMEGNPVTSIGERAFYYCEGLTTITIPDGVTSIGDGAFRGCRSLTIITIPDGVTSIGERAFYYCEGLTSITIPDSVSSIGMSAFTDCKSLTTITIPDSVTSIEFGAFSRCNSLTSITIPDSVTSIGDKTFTGCSALTTIEVGVGNVNFTEVNGVLFNTEKTVLLTYPDSKEGDNYTIPDSVSSIGKSAFDGCTGLKSITIPDGVTSIGGGCL